MKHRRSALGRQWAWPIGLSVSTIFGLLTALLGEGGLSWIALALPLAVMVRHVLRAIAKGGQLDARHPAP